MFSSPLITTYGYFISPEEFLSKDNIRLQIKNSFPTHINCFITITNNSFPEILTVRFPKQS